MLALDFSLIGWFVRSKYDLSETHGLMKIASNCNGKIPCFRGMVGEKKLRLRLAKDPKYLVTGRFQELSLLLVIT